MGLRQGKILKTDFTDKEIRKIKRTLSMILYQAKDDDYIKIFNEYETVKRNF